MARNHTAGILAVLSLVAGTRAPGEEEAALPDPGPVVVLKMIGALEGKSDPKCYATAARLEDFMYGTPLTEEARILKNQLMKRFVESVWREAGAGDRREVDREGMRAVLQRRLSWQPAADGTLVEFTGGRTMTLSARDLRQYGSVAYSLRAILATQQEGLLKSPALVRLTDDAVQVLREAGDLVGLALLQAADRRAREASLHEVTAREVQAGWDDLWERAAPVVQGKVTRAEPATAGQPLLRRIADQKLGSYAEFNQIANQLFVRNMQVYFARLSWPKDPEEAKAFRQMFTETVIAFAADLYRHAGAAAVKENKVIIGEGEVAASGQAFLPNRVNEYEDVIFFPRLDPGQRVTIEAYDFDAFRDSGIHWSYLAAALDDLAREDLPDA